MNRKRTESTWGKPGPFWQAAQPTSFDETVERLGLRPSEFETSAALKEWVGKNRNSRYVPTELLKAWGFRVDVEI